MISQNVYKYVAKKEVGSENSGESTLTKVKQVSLLEDFSEPLMCQYLVGLQSGLCKFPEFLGCLVGKHVNA